MMMNWQTMTLSLASVKMSRESNLFFILAGIILEDIFGFFVLEDYSCFGMFLILILLVHCTQYKCKCQV